MNEAPLIPFMNSLLVDLTLEFTAKYDIDEIYPRRKGLPYQTSSSSHPISLSTSH